MTEKRIYIIIPRNLDIPGDRDTGGIMYPKKITVTCGVQGGYAGHATAMLQRELFLEAMKAAPKDASGLLVDEMLEVLDVSFQFIMTLMVPNSNALDDAMFWLAQNNIRYWKYIDEDKKFPGQIPAAVITEPLDEERAALLRTYKPWRCECNSVHAKSTENKSAPLTSNMSREGTGKVE